MSVSLFVWLRYLFFVIELLVSETVLMWPQPHRGYFPLRAALAFLAVIGVSAIYSLLTYQAMESFGSGAAGVIVLYCAGFFLLFACGVAANMVCYRCSPYEYLFLCVSAYCVRQLGFNLIMLLVNVTDSGLNLFVYGQMNALNLLVYVLFCVVFYVAVYFLFCRKVRDVEYSGVGWSGLALYGIVLLVNVTVGCVVEVYSLEHFALYVCAMILQIVLMLFVLSFHLVVVSRLRLENEKQVVDNMLLQQERQYRFAKSNAELLNIKSHDLKHQAAILRAGGEEADRLISELEDVTAAHDSIVMTDNATVNVILFEKWLYCSEHGIKLSYMVDAQALDFIGSADLYSLLGNILDNCIEAVLKIGDEGKRVITLSAAKKMGVVTLSASNSYTGEIVFKGGLPVTTKENGERNHGYGMRSIKRIAEKYGGDLSISAEDGVFTLSMTFSA